MRDASRSAALRPISENLISFCCQAPFLDVLSQPVHQQPCWQGSRSSVSIRPVAQALARRDAEAAGESGPDPAS